MWREPENSFKLPDEMKWRNPDLASDLLDRKRALAHFLEEFPATAKTVEYVAFQEHG